MKYQRIGKKGLIVEALQWTGDNRDELREFCPSFIEWPNDYDDYPNIKRVGLFYEGGDTFLDYEGDSVEIPMRAYVVKHDGEYRCISEGVFNKFYQMIYE